MKERGNEDMAITLSLVYSACVAFVCRTIHSLGPQASVTERFHEMTYVLRWLFKVCSWGPVVEHAMSLALLQPFDQIMAERGPPESKTHLAFLMRFLLLPGPYSQTMCLTTRLAFPLIELILKLMYRPSIQRGVCIPFVDAFQDLCLIPPRSSAHPPPDLFVHILPVPSLAPLLLSKDVDLVCLRETERVLREVCGIDAYCSVILAHLRERLALQSRQGRQATNEPIFRSEFQVSANLLPTSMAQRLTELEYDPAMKVEPPALYCCYSYVENTTLCLRYMWRSPPVATHSLSSPQSMKALFNCLRFVELMHPISRKVSSESFYDTTELFMAVKFSFLASEPCQLLCSRFRECRGDIPLDGINAFLLLFRTHILRDIDFTYSVLCNPISFAIPLHRLVFDICASLIENYSGVASPPSAVATMCSTIGLPVDFVYELAEYPLRIQVRSPL